MDGNRTPSFSMRASSSDTTNGTQKRRVISSTSALPIDSPKRSISPLKSPETPKSICVARTPSKLQWTIKRNSNTTPSPSRGNKVKTETHCDITVSNGTIDTNLSTSNIRLPISGAHRAVVSPKRVHGTMSPVAKKHETVKNNKTTIQSTVDHSSLTQNLVCEVAKLEELTRMANETTLRKTPKESEELRNKIAKEASVVERLLSILTSKVSQSNDGGILGNSREKLTARKEDKGKEKKYSCQKTIPTSITENEKSGKYFTPRRGVRSVERQSTHLSKSLSTIKSTNPTAEGNRIKVNRVQNECSNKYMNKVNRASNPNIVICSSGPLKSISMSKRGTISMVPLDTANKPSSPWPDKWPRNSRSPTSNMFSGIQYDNRNTHIKVLPHRRCVSPRDSPVVFDFDHLTQNTRRLSSTLLRNDNERDNGMINIVSETYIYRLKLEALLAKAMQYCDEEQRKRSELNAQNEHHKSHVVLSPYDVKAMILAELGRVGEIEQGTRACIIEMTGLVQENVARSSTPTASQFIEEDANFDRMNKEVTPSSTLMSSKDNTNKTEACDMSLCPVNATTNISTQESTYTAIVSASPSSSTTNAISNEKGVLLKDTHQYRRTLQGLVSRIDSLCARGWAPQHGSVVYDGRDCVTEANIQCRQEDYGVYAEKINELREQVFLEMSRTEEIVEFCT